MNNQFHVLFKKKLNSPTPSTATHHEFYKSVKMLNKNDNYFINKYSNIVKT